MTVFDDQETVLADLQRGNFSISNASWLLGAADRVKLEGYFQNEIVRGRGLSISNFGFFEEQMLKAYSVSFETEMARIKGCRACIATSGAETNLPEFFDLSVWTDGYYFLSSPLMIRSWCRVIRNTKVGGLIVSDFRPVEQELRHFGLQLVELVSSSAYGEQGAMSAIYRRIAKTDVVELIGGLEI